MKQIIQYMISDIIEVCQYIPVGMVSGIIFFCLVLIWRKIPGFSKSKNNLSLGRCVAASFIISYFVIFLEIVFLSREPGTRIGLHLQLLETWGTDAQAHAYVIENILLFIPFGFLVPFVFSKCRSGIGTSFLGMFISICCEGIQFVTQRGHCQLDDVVMNTIGSVLGYFGYWVIWGRRDAENDRSLQEHV